MRMFGHLKAEDFINLIEGGELPGNRRSHLRACTQCSEAFESAQGFHSEMTKLASEEMDDQDIPEPDWFQFRSDVRNSMLSRAAQRQSKSSSWSGWFMRPAMTWGLAVAFAAGLSAGLLVWNHSGTNPVSSGIAQVEPPALTDAGQLATLDAVDATIPDDVSLDPGADSGLSSWSQTSVFDALSRLNDDQAEKLQQLLEADAHRGPAPR